MFRHLHAAGLAGKHVLEFGCGDGVISTLLAQFQARVTGLDISPELIAVAKRRAQLDGVQDRVEFIVQDIARSPLEAGRFDILVCHAALHHVDAQLVPPLIAALKPGGRAVIVEPIALSPALQWLRDHTGVEKHVSPGERQLSQGEICAITGLLHEPDLTFFNLFGRVSRFFRYANNIDHGHALSRTAILALFSTDRVILDIAPAVSSFCGTVVIAGNARGDANAPPGRIRPGRLVGRGRMHDHSPARIFVPGTQPVADSD
jgi:SAM-dependent methyltransferase